MIAASDALKVVYPVIIIVQALFHTKTVVKRTWIHSTSSIHCVKRNLERTMTTVLTVISSLIVSMINDVVDQSCGSGPERHVRVRSKNESNEADAVQQIKRRRCKIKDCGKRARGIEHLCQAHGAKVKRCNNDSCTNQSVQNGVCVRHGAKVKRRICTSPGCNNVVISKGVCIKHGAKYKRRPKCKYDTCSKRAIKGGVCISHGAKVKQRPKCERDGCSLLAVKHGVCRRHEAGGQSQQVCKREGCETQAIRRRLCERHLDTQKCYIDGCSKFSHGQGLCLSHGAKVKRCKVNGCQKHIISEGVCIEHGAKRKHTSCSVVHCNKQAQKGGVCIKHGAVVERKLCIVDGCTNNEVKNNLCQQHGAHPCTNDGCPGSIYWKDPEKKYCYSCFCVKHDYIPVRVKSREIHFHKLIKAGFPSLKFSYNKAQPNNCKQTRYPDWSKDFKSFFLVVECDEHQHRGKAYSCEEKRTCQIFDNSGQRPTVFVRFNPDAYRRSDGAKVRGCFEEFFNKELSKMEVIINTKEVQRRWKQIKECIKVYTDNLENPPTRAITVHKLFYDGHQS